MLPQHELRDRNQTSQKENNRDAARIFRCVFSCGSTAF